MNRYASGHQSTYPPTCRLPHAQVRELRDLLREAQHASEGSTLFTSLYLCWSHSAGALLSLCFLAQAYEHACDIIASFSMLPIGAEVG